MAMSWACAVSPCDGNSLAESLEMAESPGGVGRGCDCGALCVWCASEHVLCCAEWVIGTVSRPDLSVIGDCVTANGVLSCRCDVLGLWMGVMCACDGTNSGASVLSIVCRCVFGASAPVAGGTRLVSRLVSVVEAGDGMVVDVVSSVAEDDEVDEVSDDNDDDDDDDDVDDDEDGEGDDSRCNECASVLY